MKRFSLIFLMLCLAFSMSFAKCDNPPCGKGPPGGDGPPGQSDGGPPGQSDGGPPGQSGNSSGPAYISSDDVGLLPILLTPFKEPANGVEISINPPKTTHSRQITLKLNGGPEAAKMAISNYPDMREAGQENYSPTKKWNLCSKAGGFITYPSCPNGTYTVYAKFYNQYGQASPIISDSVKLVSQPAEKIALKFESARHLAQAIQLTQAQVIDLLNELIGTLRNKIKSRLEVSRP